MTRAVTAPHGARKKPFGPSAGRARCLAATLVLGLVAVAGLDALGRLLGLRIMLTDSAASAGIYRLLPDIPARRGELVAACLPLAIARAGLARGYLRQGDCPAGAEPIAKVIGALPGDVLDVERTHITVNGVTFSNSHTAALDSAGRALAHVAWGSRRVGQDQLWLFGFNDERSWDARYFGPVPLADVRGALRPMVTW